MLKTILELCFSLTPPSSPSAAPVIPALKSSAESDPFSPPPLLPPWSKPPLSPAWITASSLDSLPVSSHLFSLEWAQELD